ncbi:MAG: aspartyl protease family protein [Ekhidna sp.]|nr:aspartyl protease family protein [Ekhidna sp.]
MSINNFINASMRNPVINAFVFMLIINACLYSPVKGQKEFGFKVPDKMKKISIPFEQHNNLIIIPVTLNRFLMLKFILDTGVETAILTEKIYADILNLNYVREISISGPGIADSVRALAAAGITFSLPGGIIGLNMNILVLQDDYLKLSESIGDEVHGIIGYDIFSKFIVEINYDNKILNLYNPDGYKAPKKAAKIPIKLKNSKPFINASLNQDQKRENIDFMIDTGASHAALVDYSNVSTIDLPQKKVKTKLGRGIAGEIPGYLGRMDSVKIAGFEFDKVLVSAPFQGAYNKVIKRGARVGTFGGELLNRFNITFDYHNKFLYMKKGKNYKEDFEYDMSGMVINATGINLDTLKVISIDPESPAAIAGIKKDDTVLSVNGKNLRTHNLSDIYALLQSKDGRKIKVKIVRKGERMKKKFQLKRKI